MHLSLLILLNCTLAIIYFHPLNLYPGASEYLSAFDVMITLGLLTGLAYSALAIPSDSGYFAFASFGARHASQKCLCRAFLKKKLL